ncbi:MAG: TIGR03960 family B12-binding radical SAM protein [Oligoflexia bacterium]|nr:TIGR03960 family B12-binding radical SAM protein [Oligoflexia bacterium]MBF0364737.1 TIGR03960 family B12-binding radical SAM protein [Oligoflexia bacterium]
MRLKKHPYLEFLYSVERPARYVGGEHYSIRKDWDENPTMAKVALCYPDLYEVGMGHLGLKILYQELNQASDVLAERCFAPWNDLEKELRKYSCPLVSLENYQALSAFHIVGFSLQYEMTYTNMLTMIELGGISLWAKDRREEESLVVVGGPAATHPEAIAPFVDVVVIGDGEDLLLRMARMVRDARAKGQARSSILEELSTWEGIYVPALKDKNERREVKRFWIKDIGKYPFPVNSPIPHLTTIFDKFSVEIARGCTEGCRFCQAGHIYRPTRERSSQEVLSTLREGVLRGGHCEASLTALSTADYSDLVPLVKEFFAEMEDLGKVQLGISSLRAYGLDEEILDRLAQIRNTSLTFAPEVGSERMRKVVNKNISEEDMLTTASRLYERGWKKMKLYFMIGLPFEEDADVEGIMELANKIRNRGKEMGVKYPEITVSVSTFVPRPHTPFQWAPMLSLEQIKAKQEKLWELAKKYRLTFKKHSAQVSLMEAVLARGDRSMASAIFRAWEMGARFDGWEECFKFDLWTRAFAESGIVIEELLKELPTTKGALPWSHINVGVSEDYLLSEWEKAKSEISTPPCRADLCHGCGVKCDLKARKSVQVVSAAVKSDKSTGLGKEMDAVNINERSPLLFRQKRGQNVGHRYRIEFAKIGLMSFISQLDLQKVMARIFKRAQIKTLYSEGHNERPLLGFGPALALGVNSLQEYIDVRTEEEWRSVDEVLQALQKNSERGLLFLRGWEIAVKSESIQELVSSYDYFFPVIRGELPTTIASDVVTQNPFGIKLSMMEIVSKKWNEEILDVLSEIYGSEILHQQGVGIKTNIIDGGAIKNAELYQFLKAKLPAIEFALPIKTASELKYKV